MTGGGETRVRPVVYCIVPRHLARRLHEPLRRHYRDDPGVEVVVERRSAERRVAAERRGGEEAFTGPDGRRTRGSSGRRVADRRASVRVAPPPASLPRRAHSHLAQLCFVERLEPSTQELEDVDTARLVTRIQSGEQELFSELYLRYFDRVYSYMGIALGRNGEAEDATQNVFVLTLEALPRYERRPGRTFRAWLFTVARNHAINVLKRERRVDPVDPGEMVRQHEGALAAPDLPVLSWISDRELLLFVERLPRSQQQVLFLRYLLDLPASEVATILNRTPDDVRVLLHRALRFLEQRLVAVGRAPTRVERPSRWRGRLRQAPVLRTRRYMLNP